MRKVKVERLIEREGLLVVVERDVDLRLGRGDEVMLQPSYDLLLVSNPNGTPGGRLKSAAAVERQIDRVFESLPLLVREEIAKGRVAKGDGLVRAQRLGGVGIRQRPVVTFDQRLKATGGVSEVDLLPGETGIVSAGVDGRVGVVALEVASQRRVEVGLLNLHLERYVLGPFQAEEARHEILRTLKHAVLGRCPSDDLSFGIVKPPVLVVMEYTGIEESDADVSMISANLRHRVRRTLDDQPGRGSLPRADSSTNSKTPARPRH